MPGKVQPLWPRIMAKVKPNGECLEWQGSKGKHGHGYIRYQGKLIPVYRLVYLLHHGSIPEGYDVHHKCNNPPCINIAHLEAVTHRTNLLVGNSPAAVNARKTHCDRGHEYSPENTYVRSNGSRYCRTCRRLMDRDWCRKNRAERKAA